MNLSPLELDGSFFQREERVIGADAYVEAGMKPRAALADDDGSRSHNLATIGFNAKVLRIAVSPILR
jgi:hypothetical protein